MKFITPVFVLAALSQAAKQGDFGCVADAIKPLVPKAKCALPCLLSSLNYAKSHRKGEPVLSSLCNLENRQKVTKSADSCLERHCHLGGIARM